MTLFILGFFILFVTIILIIANLPQLCILDFCWTPVRDGLASKLNFYFAFLLWFTVQFIVLYIWYKTITFILKLPKNYRRYIEQTIQKAKNLLEK